MKYDESYDFDQEVGLYIFFNIWDGVSIVFHAV
jgi:hypothetical protein